MIEQAPILIKQWPDLPITEKIPAIRELIMSAQVVVIGGATGSGKTTQLPKICLDVGRGQHGMIAHTQPRRLAARAVANRISEELQSPLGHLVGLKTRFDENISEHNRIRLMTDGLLLSEIHNDRLLRRYDTIILDEAHERSLNIDFLLGYLKKLLKKRSDLKLIITSATINLEAFSRFFSNAPILQIEGRSFPVEVRYRPIQGEDPDENRYDAVVNSVQELQHAGQGDILIFLSGEREIRDCAKVLRGAQLRDTEILPLYARLSRHEQDKIFRSHIGRRVVLSTNVAETSLTVPGIRFVIDTGMARISEYNSRSKIQRLPIAKISRASAEQRKGRCGRVAAGICIRLYEEADFLSRPEFTKPEILRSNLAGVILTMKALGLGELEDFPLLDAPEAQMIRAGYKLLYELSAIDDDQNLTRLGHNMSRLPVDPQLSRMIFEAIQKNCLTEVLIIVSVLSIQDPREGKHDPQQPRKFWENEKSELMAWLTLWDAYEIERLQLTTKKLQSYCHDQQLSFMRMREWNNVHRQLTLAMQKLGYKRNEVRAAEDAIHQSLLSGFLRNVGVKDEEGYYRGIHNRRFQIFPGSSLAKKKPQWIMAATIFETSRLYAQGVAEIKPEWIESIAKDLVKYSYGEPHWEKRSGYVVTIQETRFYGLLLQAQRKINFSRVNPGLAREIFIREGLVEHELETRFTFLAHNKKLIESLLEYEDKLRERGRIVNQERLFSFYDARLPKHVFDRVSLESWIRKENTEKLLLLKESDLIDDQSYLASLEQFPNHIQLNHLSIALNYIFSPGTPDDGVTADIPLTYLNQISAEPFEWLVPGLLEQKIVALLKVLPKELRRQLQPIQESARAAWEAISSTEGSLITWLSDYIQQKTGVTVDRSLWSIDKIPNEYRMNFSILDDAKKCIAQGRDLEALKNRFSEAIVAEQAREKPKEWERTAITSWTFGALPRVIEKKGVLYYPAILDCQESVSLILTTDPHDAVLKTKQGILRLAALRTPRIHEIFRKNIPDFKSIAFSFSQRLKADALLDQWVLSSFQQVFGEAEIVDETSFEKTCAEASSKLLTVAEKMSKTLVSLAATEKQIRTETTKFNEQLYLVHEIHDHVNTLLNKEFILKTPSIYFYRLPFYFKAMLARIEKYRKAPVKDQELSRELKTLQAYGAAQKKANPQKLDEYHWMLEEYQISLFAQELKTLFPVSKKRLMDFF